MKLIPPHLQERIEKAKENQLTRLDLSNNYWENDDSKKLTEIPAEVFLLTQLEVLNLNWNCLTEIPQAIGQLSNLKELHLFGNSIPQFPDLLALLPNLIYLGIRWDRSSKPPGKIITKIKQLGIDLSNNQLTTIPESIAKLTNLTWLYLRNNQLTTVPESIAKLTNLTRLDLSNNQLTTVPEAIAKLTNLTQLYLHNNQLKTVLELIAKLTNLTKLDLRNNQLKTVPESIAKLTNLTQLYLHNNQLKSIPEAITNLTNLTTLTLMFNQLKSIPEAITNLTNLKVLYLGNNHLTTVPESIAKLTNLTQLNLNNNQLKIVPESIAKLTNLEVLNLNDNQLKTVPESIAKLTNLTQLGLGGNQLKTVPESIAKLTNLTRLSLSLNQLKSIPETITKLTNLTQLYLNNNPLENPPLEICEKGIEAIREYFRELREKGFDYIYEAKLLIIGEGGAGKTTLAKKILDPNYQLRDEDSTQGIDVMQYYFDFDPPQTKEEKREKQQFRVNIWDFGGQEIYHATHQFFLTKRSLYTLVIDNRKEDDNLIYWLNIVELLSDNSPLFIIKNQNQNRQREINELVFRGRFTNLKETLETNLATNQGLDHILTQVKHYISHLPHVGDQLPKSWTKVRKALEEDERNYITLQEYQAICQANDFPKTEQQLLLSGYLHDLGVILHFQEDKTSSLYKTIILKPEWGTAAVYKVLDNNQVKDNFGHFNSQDLEKIWHQAEYDNMQCELLQLMMTFQLCYKIHISKDSYIAPQLLSEKQPQFNWDETNNLIFRYTYNFMPKGIITQFIVAMHSLIYQNKYVWKSGVILFDNQTFAEVIESYDKREIKIRVRGSFKKELLIKITHELDKIHLSYKRLNYDKLIPCNCAACRNTQKPYFYSFDKLQDFKSKRRENIQCYETGQMVNVLNLIDDVTIDYKQQEQRPKHQSPSQSVNIHVNLNQQEDNSMTEKRIINTGGGDYTEGDSRKIEHLEIKDQGKYIEGDDNSNSSQQEKLTSIATAFEELLNFFEQNPNLTIPQAKQQIETATTNTPEILDAEILTEAIKATPPLKRRLQAAGETAYLETVKLFLPPIAIVIETIKAWNNPK